jgi:hypothetical protein
MRLQLVFPLLLLAVAAAASAAEAAATLSSRMVHRLSDEARLEAGPSGERWPRRGSGEYYRALVRSDLQRQKRRLGVKYQLLSLSKGGGTLSSGDALGWCAAFPAPVGSYAPQLFTVLLHCECYSVSILNCTTTRQLKEYGLFLTKNKSYVLHVREALSFW